MIKGIQTITGSGEVTNYYVITNTRGDVTQIYDEAGSLQVVYAYDSWGRILSVKDGSGNEITDDNNVGRLNSLRYRGYYYDEETGLYYLQSRYYDSVVGRFVNADNLIDNNSIIGSNLFTYCLNNPVMYVDPTGELAFPGQIHNLIVKHIAAKYGFYTEQTIRYKNSIKWGRADLISSSGRVWEVKPNKAKHIAKGKAQVKKYTENIWKRYPNIKLTIGGYITSDSFVVGIGAYTYYVNYYYAGGGVIAYDYREVFNKEKAKEYARNVIGVVIIAGVMYAVVQSGGVLAPVLVAL